jgi:hypothetical protein
LNIIFKLLYNLFDLSQVSLSKMAKHQDSFLSHCSYQEVLSAEKCSTLCSTLPAYEGLLAKLLEYQRDHGIDVFDILDDGITKLQAL